ncbi:hypothetical protein ACP8HI_03835 [Paenibacillus sp. FA6]|uniref:hypothetical protein n=1 Tax=Paenibacillus sp. FA6 TaxID=3413029 RepID=UPI003F658B1A
MKRIYTCSDAEWEFARYHSEVNGVDGGNKGMGCMSIFAFPIISIGCYGQYYLLRDLLPESMEGPSSWLKNAAIVLGFIGVVAFWLRSIHRPVGDTGVDASSRTVTYLLTDKEGIYINAVKNLHPKVLAYWKWSSVGEVTIDFTRDPRTFSANEDVYYSEKNKLQTFREIHDRCPDFREEVRETYTDRFMLTLGTKDKLLNRSAQIQIPRSWLFDGQFIALLGEIKRNTQITLRYFNVEAANAFLQWKDK